MALHTFSPRNPGTYRAHIAVCLAGHSLPGDSLDELGNTQAARVTRRPLGRQDMIGPGCLVTVGDRRLFAQKERSVVAQIVQPPIQLFFS